MGKASHHREQVPSSQHMHQGQVLFFLPGTPQKTKFYNCHTDAESLGWSHVSSLAVGTEPMSSQKFRSVVSVRFPIVILTPPPPSLQLDSWSSAQCLAVDLCICSHQLLDEGSMMTRPSNTTLGHIPKGCSFISEGHLLSSIHSSIICNNQNQETT